jgi:hypothetical protein
VNEDPKDTDAINSVKLLAKGNLGTKDSRKVSKLAAAVETKDQ